MKRYRLFLLLPVLGLAGCLCAPPGPAAVETSGGAEVAAAAPAAVPTPSEEGAYKLLETLPMGIIGGVEPVYIEDIPAAFPARIDTGADFCSLDAAKLKYFERDGKPFVAFEIEHRDGKCYTFERQVKRRVTIKRHGMGNQVRPLVEMKVRFGRQTFRREFTLADREKFEYQVLIGRNLLNGLVAVDVSRSNTLKE